MKAISNALGAIVVGGGISGLAAARDLAKAGKKVVLIEARNRLGGRIFTERPKGWGQPIELGAEFIHVGNADIWRLVKASRTLTIKLPDAHWQDNGRGIEPILDLDARIEAVTGKIDKKAAGSLSFAGYFDRHPPEATDEEWKLAKSFVEGFEAAPLDGISAKSLAHEAMDEGHQYILPGGYDRLVGFLASECVGLGVTLLTGTIVDAVKWTRGRARVSLRDSLTRAKRYLSCAALVITVPLGILKARSGRGHISFSPPLKAKEPVLAGMQMGHVVRVALRFSKAGWKRMLPERLRHRRTWGFGFIHSSVKGMSVWWSLSHQPILVGWAGGPAASVLSRLAPTKRRQEALRSLAEVLRVPVPVLKKAVIEMREWDWNKDAFSRGAYSFTAAGQDDASAELAKPVQQTLFFAGEATATGSEVGTVHGAMKSGRRAAAEVIRAARRRARGPR